MFPFGGIRYAKDCPFAVGYNPTPVVCGIMGLSSFVANAVAGEEGTGFVKSITMPYVARQRTPGPEND